jgi:ABC-2 type transport system permease protein
MQACWTLIRRELAGYFLSLTGYIIIAAATVIMGVSFWVLLDKLQQSPTPIPITEMWTPLIWVIMVVTTPVITMRLFALEKFSGTFETLMTAPVSDLQVVLAKFTAGVFFYAVMWLPLLGGVLIIRHYANEPGAIDAGILGSTFLGILLLGSLFVSLGCLTSAVTRSQVSAAMLSLVSGVSLFLVGILADHLPPGLGWQTEALAPLAFFEQMHDFARGVVDTRPVVLYLTFTWFFLFLTLRVVESRRWK